MHFLLYQCLSSVLRYIINFHFYDYETSILGLIYPVLGLIYPVLGLIYPVLGLIYPVLRHYNGR